jgi:SSS family solute:Na+ symporter
VLAPDPQLSIDLQLIGGVIIMQTLSAIVLGLWRTIAHCWALLAGWAVGVLSGLLMLYDTHKPSDRPRALRRRPVRPLELRFRD